MKQVTVVQSSVDVDVVEVCAIIVQKTENGGNWWCGRSSKCATSFFVPLLGRAIGVWREWAVVICRREE